MAGGGGPGAFNNTYMGGTMQDNRMMGVQLNQPNMNFGNR